MRKRFFITDKADRTSSLIMDAVTHSTDSLSEAVEVAHSRGGNWIWDDEEMKFFEIRLPQRSGTVEQMKSYTRLEVRRVNKLMELGMIPYHNQDVHPGKPTNRGEAVDEVFDKSKCHE